jgi:capsular exopolysaccharide synthesis family protein
MQADHLRKLTRKWAIPIIVVTILGAAASYVVSHHMTPMYAATGSVLVIAGPGEAVGNGSTNAGAATATAAALLAEPTLLEQVISELHLNTTVDKLSKEVSAAAETSTELVDVTVNDPSPARAAQIANTLMSAYVTQISKANTQRILQAGAAIHNQINTLQNTVDQEQRELTSAANAGQDTTQLRAAMSDNNAQLAQLSLQLGQFDASQAQTLGAVSVAQVASPPLNPASPSVVLNTVAGALAALLLAAGIAYLVEYFDQGLKGPDDVRERLDISCLGVIPKFRHIPGRGSLEPNHRHDEAVREAYRRLRINLLFAAPDDNLKTIAITSVRAGEGKTCTAANLSVALAGSDRHVLLIDADLRKPDQHRLFGTTLEGGLSDLILKRPTTARVQVNGFRQTQFTNLSLLTSGTIPPNPAELLASKRAIALLNSIGPEEDLIVIDTAPAGLVTDALSIAAGASGTILVVEAGKTKASEAAGTIDALREVGANVIGVVLNKTSRRVGAGYSYRYGYSQYGKSDSSLDGALTRNDLAGPHTEPVLDDEPPPKAVSSGALTVPLR